jgi:RND family efflux transporter MFP subunit
MEGPVQRGLEGQERLRADLESLRMNREPDATLVRRKVRRRRRWPWLVLALLLVAGIVVQRMSRALPVRTVRAVASAEAANQPVPVLSGAGYLVPGDKVVAVGSRVPGRVARYLVDEGDHVKQGQALVELDDREYRAAVDRNRARLASARARTELARLELVRGRELRARDSVSSRELDVRTNELALSQAAVDEAEAAVREAELNLEHTVLRSPSDAVVLAKLKEAGEIAVPGGFSGSGDLVRLANMTEVRAEVDVNESDLPRIRMGQRAEVAPDALPDVRYPAEVAKLYPQVDRQKGTLKVEVRLDQPDSRLLPDMSARVSFLGDAPAPGTQGPQVLLPADAVHRATDGRSYVWVVADGVAKQVYVEQSGLLGDSVRISSGLQGEENVVVGEPPTRDGQRVQPQP